MTSVETITKPLFPHLSQFQESGLGQGIVTDEECERAEEMLAGYKHLKAEATKAYTEMLAPLNERRAVIHGWRNNDLESIAIVEKTLTTLLSNYRAREHKQREEAATKALKAAEAQANTDRDSQVAALRDEADLVRTEGENGEGAMLLEREAKALEQAPQPIIEVLPNSVLPERKSSLTAIIRYSAKVSNLRALVREAADGKVSLLALQPNQTWLNQQARSMKESLEIGGVELVKTESFKRKASNGGQV